MKHVCLLKRLCGPVLVAVVLLLPLTAAVDSYAGATGYEDVMSGFDEKGASAANAPAAGEDEGLAGRLDLSGEATLSSVWNVAHEKPDPGQTDYRGLSRLRASLDLTLEAKFTDTWGGQVSGRGFYDFAYHIQGHDEFTRDVLDEYEDELEFRETYIEGKPAPGLDIRAGRQLVIWGNSETFRVTDIINPLDSRDPGLVDIEDLRLPVCMIRTDYQWRNPSGYYDLTGIVIPELRFNKTPVYGNDFYPFDMSLPHEEIPGQSFENSEYAMALKGVFPHWDFSLYGAYYYDNESYMEKTGVISYPIQLPDNSVIWQTVDIYERWHSRLWMTGLCVNYAVGDWLLKTELARSDGYQYANDDGRKSQTRGLAGVEYMGFTDTTLTLEFMQSVLNGYDHDMGEAPDYADSSRFDTAFRFTQNRMNDRLELVFVAVVMGMEAEDGLIERLSAAYDITDAFTVTGGCIFYQDGDSVLNDNIHDNNRVFMDLTYAF
ncbi:MAG: DUF1302 family protein [Thermodesulfobacteriota bacterium]